LSSTLSTPARFVMDKEDLEDNHKPLDKKTIIFPPWRLKSSFYVSKSDLIGSFAKWSIRQSPYMCPDDLVEACGVVDRHLDEAFEWDGLSNIQLSCNDIRMFFENIFHRNALFKKWNTPKVTAPLTQAEKYRDNDFIDLSALARNIAHDLVVDEVVWT
jgi:hypothetical protein